MKSFANLSSFTIVSLFLALLSGGCATVPVKPMVDPTNAPAARLANAMAGDYRRALTGDSMTAPIRDKRLKIDALGSGEWLYHQHNPRADLDQITRRQILSLTAQPDGRVIQTNYTVPPPIPRPLTQETTKQWLATLTRDQLRLEMNPGCNMIWIEMPNGWSGQIDPGRCDITPSTRSGASHLGARTELIGSRLRTAKTGYDANGNRLWGEEDGQWVVLYRTP